MKPLRHEDVTMIVVHCAGNRCNQPFTVPGLIATGNERFGQPSYHYYVRRSGQVVGILPENVRGIHATGYNYCSIAVCYEGGLDEHGNAADTRTAQQKQALLRLLTSLHDRYPRARILGHCELPHVTKRCPCFCASKEYAALQPATISSDHLP